MTYSLSPSHTWTRPWANNLRIEICKRSWSGIVASYLFKPQSHILANQGESFATSGCGDRQRTFKSEISFATFLRIISNNCTNWSRKTTSWQESFANTLQQTEIVCALSATVFTIKAQILAIKYEVRTINLQLHTTACTITCDRLRLSGTYLQSITTVSNYDGINCE